MPNLTILGCGLIASAVIDAALDRGETSIRVISRSFPDAYLTDDRIECVFGDVGSGALVDVLEPDSILVVATGSPDPRCPPSKISTLLAPASRAVTEIVEECSKLSGMHVVLTSSGGAGYGPQGVDPIDETTLAQPDTVYGAIKLAEEQLLNVLESTGDNTVTSLRCSTVIGVRRGGYRGQGLVQHAADRFAEGAPVNLFNMGAELRGYIDTQDLAQVILAVGDRPDRKHNVYNACSTNVYSNLDVVKTVAEVMDVEADYTLEPGDPRHIVLDTTRLVDEFAPTFRSLRDSVEEMCSTHMAHNDQGVRPKDGVR